MERALVLNASDEPLGITSTRRAAILVLTNKADMVESTGRVLRSAKREIVAPTVVRLRNYVHVPYRRPGGAPSLAGLRARDGMWCAYCIKKPATTIDHVKPRSKKGAHTWENTVGACAKCNSRKANRTPEQAGMTLRFTPAAPPSHIWLVLAMAEPNPSWAAYMGGLGLESRHAALEPAAV
jgi:5-methylcytosine-specific restriction endonuclease McrA